ncbi:MAG: hypothetical protein OXR66_04075 [Candidatus Woesearchaeota archaeon]|nr:hypothetical protein [Candidatus Woesearchaeota archaeon]
MRHATTLGNILQVEGPTTGGEQGPRALGRVGRAARATGRGLLNFGKGFTAGSCIAITLPTAYRFGEETLRNDSYAGFGGISLGGIGHVFVACPYIAHSLMENPRALLPIVAMNAASLLYEGSRVLYQRHRERPSPSQ